MDVIAHYGFSANPFHNGHRAIVELLRRSGLVDGVVAEPCGARPEPEKRGFVDPVHRLAMTRLGLEDVAGGAWLDIDEADVYQTQFTPHVDLLERQKAQRGPAKILPVIGMDLLLVREDLGGRTPLETWADSARLVARWEFLVVRRGNVSLGSPLRMPPRSTVLEGPPIPEVSSSDIRRRIAAGEPWEHLVTPNVAEYVREHGLYR